MYDHDVTIRVAQGEQYNTIGVTGSLGATMTRDTSIECGPLLLYMATTNDRTQDIHIRLLYIYMVGRQKPPGWAILAPDAMVCYHHQLATDNSIRPKVLQTPVHVRKCPLQPLMLIYPYVSQIGAGCRCRHRIDYIDQRLSSI